MKIWRWMTIILGIGVFCYAGPVFANSCSVLTLTPNNTPVTSAGNVSVTFACTNNNMDIYAFDPSGISNYNITANMNLQNASSPLTLAYITSSTNPTPPGWNAGAWTILLINDNDQPDSFATMNGRCNTGNSLANCVSFYAAFLRTSTLTLTAATTAPRKNPIIVSYGKLQMELSISAFL